MNLVLNFLVVTATVLGSAMAYPQARRINRTRRVDGVSAMWIGVSIALNSWWLVYGFAADVFALVPVSAAALTLYAVMAFGFFRTVGRGAAGEFMLGALGLGMIPLPFLLIGGWPLAGVAVGLCYGVQLLPAVVAACRTSSLAGVSAATWLIAWLEAAIWLIYGAGVGDVALILAGGSGAFMASIILARLVVTGHRPFVVLDPRRGLRTARAA